MRTSRIARSALVFGLSGLLFSPLACGGEEPFSNSSGGGDAGSGTDSTKDPDVAPAGGSGPDENAAGGVGAQSVATGGQPVEASCKKDTDCPAASACSLISCMDGECVEAPLAEDTACDEGMCDGQGKCIGSTCASGEQDGDETGVDCGGSCELCDDGAGCKVGTDCLSGVCTGEECQPSGCTDEVKNGTETGVDCGGTCGRKCLVGEGCAAATDCSVTPGKGPETVRCLDKVCTSTEPPGDAMLYWQDFHRSRLKKAGEEESCEAPDGVCLYGNGPRYQMHLINPDGAKANLKETLFTDAGAVGSGGSFTGKWCITRGLGTSLSAHDEAAVTAMAWVKSTRSAAPWESVIFGAPKHYMIALDNNPASQRFLAAVATPANTSFMYRNSTGTAEVMTGEWHHVAAVYDTAGGLVQYVDGVEVHRTAMTGNVTTGAVDVYMGCRMDKALSQFFIGTMDELVVYRRALTGKEVSDYVRRTNP